MPAPGLPRTFGSGYCTFPQPKLIFFLLHFLLGNLTMLLLEPLQCGASKVCRGDVYFNALPLGPMKQRNLWTHNTVYNWMWSLRLCVWEAQKLHTLF